MLILKNIVYSLLVILLLIILIGISVVVAVYNSWSLWRGFLFFLIFTSTCVFFIFLLSNASTIYKWARHAARRFFKFENKLKYIAYTCFIKGVSVQCKRRYLPIKWFSKVPPRWFLVTDMFDSGCELLLQDPTISPMKVTTSARKKSHKPCRWWFFRHAMYLSIPGRFIYNQHAIAATWRYLIRWIWLWCRSPTAIIVSIPVKWLSETSNEQLHTHARMLRSALGMFFKSQEKRLPIYLVVTNLQQIGGAEKWLQLNDGIPLGMTGGILKGGYYERVNYQLTKARENFGHSLSLQRLNILRQSLRLPEDDLLHFPERIIDLFESLKNFLSPLCEKDKYLEYGVLSGVFMSGQYMDKQGRVRGIFSPYLLDEFIPHHDVNIPQQCVPGLWWFIRKSIYVSIFLAVIVLFVSAFNTVKRELSDIKIQTNASSIETSHLRLEQLIQLNSDKINNIFFGYALNFLERREARNFLNLTSAQEFHVNAVNKELLDTFHQSSIQQQANLIVNWARFINSEKEIDYGAPLSKIDDMPAYSFGLLAGTKLSMPFSQQLLRRKALNILGEKQDFALWCSTLMSMLKSKNDLSWVLAADLPAVHRDISVAAYWRMSKHDRSFDDSSVDGQKLQGDTALAWIYTLAGERFVRQTLDQIQSATGDSPDFIASRQSFWNFFLHRRQTAWINFASKVHVGKYSVNGEKNWRDLLTSIIYDDSPYDRVVSDMQYQLATINDDDAEPWLILLRHLQKQKQFLESTNLATAIARSPLLLRIKMLRRARKEAHVNSRNNKNLFADTTLSRRKYYESGVKNLAQLVLDDPRDANKFLDPNVSNSDSKNSSSSIASLFTDFSRWKEDSSEQEIDQRELIIWDLFKSDTQLISDYLLLSVASQLQDSWNSKIVWPLNAQTQNTAVDIDGVAKDTYKNIASFLKKNSLFVSLVPGDGFSSAKLNNESLPFTQVFINYINTYVNVEDVSGQSVETRKRLLDEKLSLDQDDVAYNQSSATSDVNGIEKNKPVELVIQGRPSTANADALVLPYATSIRLRCDESIQSLKYMNFDTTQSLHWQPSLCGDMMETIFFPGFSITKEYSGLAGILDYIKDFSSGEHTYNVNEFPDNVALLKKNNVKYITVRYNLTGVSNVEAAYSAWQNDENYFTEKNNKKAAIESQLMSIEQPVSFSGILTSLPNDIVSPWVLSSVGNK